MNVAVVGASDNPERYAYRALSLLQEKGHTVFPVHPRLKTINDIPVFSSLQDIPSALHTITLYIGKDRSDPMIGSIVKAKPLRLIINPGAENQSLESLAREAGISVIRACTLVLLSTGKFDK